MQHPIIEQIVQILETLPLDLQQRVLEFAQTLSVRQPVGVSGTELLQFVGTIPPEDLELMKQAIEEDCE